MTHEEIIRMAREAGFEHIAEAEYWHPLFERFANLVAAAEREACAKVLDANVQQCSPSGYVQEVLRSNAAAIRARGTKRG